MRLHLYISIYVCMLKTYIHTWVQTHSNTNTHIHTHAYKHIHINTNTHIHTYTHIQTHIHKYMHTSNDAQSAVHYDIISHRGRNAFVQMKFRFIDERNQQRVDRPACHKHEPTNRFEISRSRGQTALITCMLILCVPVCEWKKCLFGWNKQKVATNMNRRWIMCIKNMFV